MQDQNIDLSNHCFVTQSSDLSKILAQVLEPFKITFFRYLRLNKDGTRIDLCTDSTWTNHFYNQGLYKVAWWDRCLPTLNVIERTMWDEKCLTSDNIVGIHARTVFDIIHGYSIIKPTQDYCEVYDFATTKGNVIINDVYMRYPEYFEDIIFFFNYHARHLVKEAELNTIYLPMETTLADAKMCDSGVMEYVNRFYLEPGHSGAYLTKKEFSCLSLWFSGKTAKQISLILGISHRTVETHFDNIKGKFNLHNKNQLANKLQALGLFETLVKNGLRLDKECSLV